jgi:membrane-bound metal-dependent hydrolase YbcI (DUF457 family)
VFRLLFRRADFTVAAVLVGTVVALDLLWGLIAGSTGDLAYALIDEPAHLATCAVALLALAAARGRLPAAFVLAALLASVAIDLDHIPGYLGSGLLGGNQPRPDTHSLLLVFFFVGLGLLPSRRLRPIALGIAFGLATHLLRDLATGPGIPIFWPFSSEAFTIPYAGFVVVLVLCLVAVAPRGARLATRLGVGVSVAVVALAIGAWNASPAPAAPARDAIGIYIPGADWDPELIDRYASEVGHQPAIVSIYRDWSSQPFEPPVLDPIAARGAVPFVTWEPWRNWSEGISLRAIANGAYDGYIAEAARAAAAWGGPLFVRFAQEMNGGWYLWGRVRGNTPRIYKAAWRRLVEVFRRQGADNVRWVWTPYVEGDNQRPFRRYYPGDRWVDWAGLDGFNWGGKFVSFTKIFQRSYKTIVKMTQKPLIVGETGSVENGGNKPAWIRRALDVALPRYGHIRALVWWDNAYPENGSDLRLDTSAESLAAWSEALQAQRLQPGRKFLLERPAWLRRR